jgi:monoamine oxidase
LPHARAARTLLLEMGIARMAEPAADGDSLERDLEYDESQLVRAPQERVFVADRWYEGQYPHAGASRDDQAELARFEAEVARLVAQRDAAGRRAFSVPMAYGSPAPELLELDGTTFDSWLSQRGFRSPRLRWWLEYGTRDDMGATLTQTSAFMGLHYHAARVTAAGPSNFLTWPEGNAHLIAHLQRAAGPRVRTGVAVTRVRQEPDGRWQLQCFEPSRGSTETLLADHVIFAIPQSVVARVLATPLAPVLAAVAGLETGSWLVANLTLKRRPAARGHPLCWDNVLYGSRSVGYVVATHQSDSVERQRSVWTW